MHKTNNTIIPMHVEHGDTILIGLCSSVFHRDRDYWQHYFEKAFPNHKVVVYNRDQILFGVLKGDSSG